MKTDIRTLDEAAAMAALRAMRPVEYRLKMNPEEKTLGFIAEEVPGLVAASDRATINPVEIVAVLTRALQAQQRVIEDQQTEAAKLEQRLARLEQRLAADTKVDP